VIRFIYKIVVFTFPILIFICFSEFIIKQIPNDYSYKNEYLTKNAQHIQILILGSSHSFFGINPKYFSKNSFNAAHVSQSLKYDLFILKKFKKNFSNLKVLILPISYFTLFTQLEDGQEHWRAKYYSLYYNCRYHSNLMYNTEVMTSKPLTIIELLIKYFNGENNITVSNLGFGLSYTNTAQSDLRKSGISAAKRHTKNSNMNLLDTNLKLLSNIFTECDKMGVHPIIFTPPAWKSYRDNIDIKQFSMMKTSLASVLKKYANVKYYDFMEDDRFHKVDYKDADHLNDIGAKKLTRILDEIIQTNDKIYIKNLFR
jgi:hypothetical protein